MGFHEVLFPVGISYGSRGGPGFSTSVVELSGGTEQRIARWNGARRRYNARIGIRGQEDVSDLLEFYIARRGAENGFRWKDWTDYTTASDHRSAPDDEDEQIGTGDGSTTTFQLVKTYTSGGVTRTRNLTKPVSGTTVVALDGVAQASGWTVDTTTGIVTFSTAPGTDVVITAGCEFDVPVRFGEELDEAALQVQQDDYAAETLPDIPVVEIVGGEATQDEFFFGGAHVAALTDDLDLSLLTARVYVLTPDAGGHYAFLPDPAALPDGFPHFIVTNASGTYTFTVDAPGLATLTEVLAAGATMVLFIADGEWRALS